MKRLLASTALAATFAAVSAFPGAAQTVYRTVENGVTTFSDTPPEDGAAEVIEVNAPPVAKDEELERRLAEMRETTDRMASDRREREKQRAELRALNRRDTEVAAAPVAPGAAWTGGYWPAYGRPPFLHHAPIGIRPPHRPRPPVPWRTPMNVPEGWSVIQPGNDQLMRPIVSGRDGRPSARRN